MNLLAKIWIGLLTFTSLFIFSCGDPSEIGLELDPDALSTEIFYEELSLTAENVLNDSVRTSGTGEMLIGATDSDIFGSTSSTAMTRLFTDNTSLVPLENNINTIVETDPPGVTNDTITWQYYVYDSTEITLEYSSLHTLGALSQTQTITLHQLDDELLAGVYYLSKFDIPYLDHNPEDEFSFIVDADSLEDALASFQDTIVYNINRKISDGIGNQLFEIVKNDRTSENLRYDFKGVALVPGSENNLLIGFNVASTSNITTYYHIVEVDAEGNETIARENLGAVFSFSTANARFNKIDVDRTGSLIGNNIGEDLEGFDTGDDMVYLNPATGIYPRISLEKLFEFFGKFDQENGNVIQISKAEMILTSPINDEVYNKNAANVRFLFMDDGEQINTSGLSINDLRNTIVVTDAGYLSGTQSAVVAAYDSASQTYVGPMTFFIQQVEKGDIDVEKLALMPLDANIYGSSKFSISDIKLRLYYASTNQ